MFKIIKFAIYLIASKAINTQATAKNILYIIAPKH